MPAVHGDVPLIPHPASHCSPTSDFLLGMSCSLLLGTQVQSDTSSAYCPLRPSLKKTWAAGSTKDGATAWLLSSAWSTASSFNHFFTASTTPENKIRDMHGSTYNQQERGAQTIPSSPSVDSLKEAGGIQNLGGIDNYRVQGEVEVRRKAGYCSNIPCNPSQKWSDQIFPGSSQSQF